MSINSQYVRIVASDTYKPTEQPAKSLYLRVLGIKPRGTGFPEQGAGRLAVNIARKVRIDIWVRNQQDNVANDTAALTAPNIGLFFLEEQVLNLLIDYDPKINNKLILLEPVHLTEGDETDRPEKPDIGMIVSSLYFEVVYVAALDTTDPASADQG